MLKRVTSDFSSMDELFKWKLLKNEFMHDANAYALITLWVIVAQVLEKNSKPFSHELTQTHEEQIRKLELKAKGLRPKFEVKFCQDKVSFLDEVFCRTLDVEALG